MQYKVIQINNSTATVIMTIGDNSIQQNFDLGKTTVDLDMNIRSGLEIFQRDLKAVKAVPDEFIQLIGQTVVVD